MQFTNLPPRFVAFYDCPVELFGESQALFIVLYKHFLDDIFYGHWVSRVRGVWCGWSYHPPLKGLAERDLHAALEAVDDIVEDAFLGVIDGIIDGGCDVVQST